MDVRDLSIRFGGVAALSGVSLTVNRGGLTAIIGPNGAGKTTLFNCVSGLYRGEGEILLDGEPVQGLSAAERSRLGVARTFQTPAFVENMSVLENVMLGCYRWTSAGLLETFIGRRRVRDEEREARQTAYEMLRRLDLESLAGKPVTGLPHRQRRLVEIARAFASRSRILLLDEPAAGSHHSEARAMLMLVKEIADESSTTLVLVEHNVTLVMEFARDIAVLNFGELISRGAPSQVRQDQRVIDAYLGQEPV